MPGIIEFPQVVKQAQGEFADLFYGEPQRRHFAEYLTGLMVADRKTVLGIHDEFAQTTDQSCLNRFLTSVEWDEQAVNQRRLDLIQRQRDMRYSDRGVIAIDNVLIDHEGLLIEDVGWFWDHSEERYKIAHDDLFVNYVAASGKHFPLEFARFRKREHCQAEGTEFRSHTELCCALIDWAVSDQQIPGDFTFDTYFTCSDVQNCVHRHRDAQGRPRAYVGALKSNRTLRWKDQLMRVDELAASIAAADRKPLGTGSKRQWYWTVSVRLPRVSHKVRIVILWKDRHDAEPCKILVTNRTTWDATRIVRVYRARWTGTETFHRDGKQQLGMGDCQLRHGLGQTRHIYMVMLAYSLLMLQLQQPTLKDWVWVRLTTIGEACRAVLKDTLRSTLDWAFEQLHTNHPPHEILAHLGLANPS